MKEKFKHIATIFMMIVFIIYSIGIEIHHHICTSNGVRVASLFKNIECPCIHGEKEKSNCEKCNNEAPKQAINTDQESDACCLTQSEDIDVSDCEKCTSKSKQENNSKCNNHEKSIAEKCCVNYIEKYEIDDEYQLSGFSNTIVHYTNIEYIIPSDEYNFAEDLYSENILINNPRDNLIDKETIIKYIHLSSQKSDEDFFNIS